ncbi:hypothetical protein N0V93_009806 [Gnomoniopsis smithogilvyi]|uniref:Rhodopsin domain-containing protein n=1 Tax=Gnomoniopsis smithogilvyi TaxID=1191159 RepID=A0A9W8YJ50_9PEZI|nr:hypothetical protein N0V93_009806 [Gnomoniopsis smithogilvyi]
MYLQFFGIKRPMRIAVYVGLAVTFAAYWTSIPIAAYYGAPHSGETWEELFVNLRPAKEAYWGFAQGVCAIVLDIYIFILPLPVLWRLHMDRAKRLQLLGVFGTALIAVAASCVALNFRINLLPTGKTTPADDTTWSQACTSIAVMIESNIAIVVGSMPAFGAFVRTTSMDSSFLKSWQSRLLRGSGSGKPTSWSKESLPKYPGHKIPSVSLRQENPYLIHQQQGVNTSFDSLEQEDSDFAQERYQHGSSTEPLGFSQGAPHYELRDASGFTSEANMDAETQGQQEHHRGILRSFSVFQKIEPKYPNSVAQK